MARARGANAQMALAIAPSYGAIPTSGFRKMPLVTEDLGEEQQLIANNILGFGRAPLASDLGAADNRGSMAMPVDIRYVGIWLTLALGLPATTQGVAATGSITVGGQAFTFKAALSGANQILIGATLADTVGNAVRVLNASAVPGVMAATYSTDLDYKAVLVTHDTIGTAGNTFAIAASAATTSGATLAGGSASGPYNHVFTAGALSLPDAAIEIGNPEVPSYSMNFGVAIDGITIPLARAGNLDMTLAYIAQGELPPTPASAAGTLVTPWALERFSQFTGQIELDHVPLGEITSGRFQFGNGGDAVEVIRRDGRIAGVDPGDMSLGPQIVSRFSTNQLYNLAISSTAVDLAYGWSKGPGKSLTLRQHAVRLPKVKRPITGPGGVVQTFNGLGEQDTTGKFLTATLVNDVASYA